MKIEDSGERREFVTGAVRDRTIGKGRFDLMPMEVIATYMSNDAVSEYEFVSNLSQFSTGGITEYLYQSMKNIIELAFNNNFNTAMLELAKHFEEGCDKYGDRNWQKGIPINCYIDSALRHYFKYMAGRVDESHDRACLWNIVCCIWSCENIDGSLEEYMKLKEQL